MVLEWGWYDDHDHLTTASMIIINTITIDITTTIVDTIYHHHHPHRQRHHHHHHYHHSSASSSWLLVPLHCNIATTTCQHVFGVRGWRILPRLMISSVIIVIIINHHHHHHPHHDSSSPSSSSSPCIITITTPITISSSLMVHMGSLKLVPWRLNDHIVTITISSSSSSEYSMMHEPRRRKRICGINSNSTPMLLNRISDS